MVFPEVARPATSRAGALGKVQEVSPFGVPEAAAVLSLAKIMLPVHNDERQTHKQLEVEAKHGRDDRLVIPACIIQNLMREAEIPASQQVKASVSILKGPPSFFIKRAARPYQLAAQEEGSWRTEQVLASKEIEAADVAPPEHCTRVREPIQMNFIALEFVSSDNANRRICLGHLHHAPDTIRKDPVIGLDHFAVLALRRDTGEREVVILRLA
jgi:hypothetical protein